MQAPEPKDDIASSSDLNPSKFSISVVGPSGVFDRPGSAMLGHRRHAVRQVISETEPRKQRPLDTDSGLIPTKMRMEDDVQPVSAAVILGLLGVADGFAIFVSGVAPALLPFFRDAVDWQGAEVTIAPGTIL